MKRFVTKLKHRDLEQLETKVESGISLDGLTFEFHNITLDENFLIFLKTSDQDLSFEESNIFVGKLKVSV